MLIFLQRWLAYFLIPAGLVLLLFPLNTHRYEESEKDFVFLEVNETLEDTITVYKPITPENPDTEELLRFIEAQQKTISKDFSTDATIINPYGYPVIEKQDFTRYPILAEQAEDMMQTISLRRQERIGSKRLDNVPISEWKAFSKAFLGHTDIAYFQYGNRVFKGQIKSAYTPVQVEVEYLNIALKMVGGIFLLLSFITLQRLYVPPSNGIQIGKRLWMVVWDVIVIAIGVFFISGFIDSMLEKYFQIVPFWRDEKLAFFMGVFWVTIGSLIMALYITATALQSVSINADGITVKGLFSRKFMSWSDVNNIHLGEIFLARRVYGFFAPRKVAKILKISGDSSILRIMEPPVSSTKKEILLLLTTFAPERLKGAISDLSSKWLSVW